MLDNRDDKCKTTGLNFRVIKRHSVCMRDSYFFDHSLAGANNARCSPSHSPPIASKVLWSCYRDLMIAMWHYANEKTPVQFEATTSHLISSCSCMSFQPFSAVSAS